MQGIGHILQVIQHELHFEYIHSSGPGGQNVNKVATAVQLRFNIRDSHLPDAVKERLYKIAGKRVSTDGLLIIEAKRYRSQEQNRQDAMKRLTAILSRTLDGPKQRKKTKPSKAARKKRLEVKRQKSEIKRNRQGSFFD
jgi:ribosome-associated protein